MFRFLGGDSAVLTERVGREGTGGRGGRGRPSSHSHEDQAQEESWEGEREQGIPETISVSDGEEDVGRPSQWNVQQVFS